MEFKYTLGRILWLLKSSSDWEYNWVSGTTASEDGKVIGVGDVTLQTEYIIKKIEHTLVEAGFSLKDVVRTRIFMTDISLWEEVAKVHSYLFEDVMPASTLIEVSKLIDPDLLIEIEAIAIKEDI